ncbi:hypothetical protein Cflav_PD4435 [Pedosphaera parvula Ellin514]|uniref:Uncharacterized protein n=1 Tax=Pedosphaera parvula (strain Ellin514) TaxID=320771 RepID=B9XFQ0_PEDPL|nr:hypothetical protein Cflav_PD4435 [Pedosphaera parvula Ellin514]
MLRGIEAWRWDGVVGRVREGDREARLETPHVVSYARERAWRLDGSRGSRARVGVRGVVRSWAVFSACGVWTDAENFEWRF